LDAIRDNPRARPFHEESDFTPDVVYRSTGLVVVLARHIDRLRTTPSADSGDVPDT